MALNLVTNPPTELTTSSNWTTLVNREDYGMVGHGLSIPIFTLTEWEAGNTTVPGIAKGSIIEVDGSFYLADADTALNDDTGLVDGTVRIKLVPTGGGATVTPTLTSDTLPAWDAEKGGWYDGATKFLPFQMTKASTVYSDKQELMGQDDSIIKSVEGGLIASGGLTLGGTIGPIKPIDATIGSITVPANGTILVPRGTFLFGVGPTGTSNQDRVDCEIFNGSTWTLTLYDSGSYRFVGGLVISDGTNVRLSDSRGNSAVLYYLKY